MLFRSEFGFLDVSVGVAFLWISCLFYGVYFDI